MFIVTRWSLIFTFQPVLVLMKCIVEDRLMGFVGDSLNKTIVHFDLVTAETKAVTWPGSMPNVMSAFNRDNVSIVVLVKDKPDKVRSYIINFETNIAEKVPLPARFERNATKVAFFADKTITMCGREETETKTKPKISNDHPICFQLTENIKLAEWSKYYGTQRQLLSSGRGWEFGFHGKVLCPYLNKDYFVNTCITDKHSNKSFLLYLGGNDYATFMGNRYRKSYFKYRDRHFMPAETNIDTTRSDKIRLTTNLDEDPSVIMSLLGGEYLVRSNGTHLYFNDTNATARQIKAIKANQPNPYTLFWIKSCAKPNRTEETSPPSQKRESTAPQIQLINNGYFTTAESEKLSDESKTTMNTATRTTSSRGNQTTIRNDISTTPATSHEPGSLKTMEVEKPREKSVTTMNTATRTTSSQSNLTTIRNDLSTTRAISHEPELENGTHFRGEYVAIIVLLGFILLGIVMLAIVYVSRRKRNQQLPSSTSGTTFSESENIQRETTKLYSTEPVNHDELNIIHGSEREPALVVAFPNNQVCQSMSNDARSPSSATLSLSVTPTPGIDSSTIKSMSGIFAQANEVKHSIPVKQHKSTSKVETISTNIPSGSVHSLNPRANRSESDPGSLSQLPIQILKRIWRHKIRKKKQAKQQQIE